MGKYKIRKANTQFKKMLMIGILFQRQFICTLLSSSSDIFFENLKTKVADKVGNAYINRIEELGILEDDLIEKYNTPVDTLSNLLQKKLTLGKAFR